MTDFKQGDKVVDRYGQIREVHHQSDTIVYFTDGQWTHRTKCWKAEMGYKEIAFIIRNLVETRCKEIGDLKADEANVGRLSDLRLEQSNLESILDRLDEIRMQS